MSLEEAPWKDMDQKEAPERAGRLKKELPSLLSKVENPLEGLQKKEYQEEFARYMKGHVQTFLDLERELGQSGDPDALVAELTDSFVQSVSEDLKKEPKSRRREARLTDYNLTLVLYVFPALLERGTPSGKAFAEALLQKWKERFPRTNLHLTTYEEIEAGFHKRRCYITTAVCLSLQKGDDCEELRLLRNYRDTYLANAPDGMQVIREYYDVAPTIVKHIDHKAASEQIYQDIYDGYLKQCIHLIQEGKMEECRKVYATMVYDLKAQYFIEAT